MRPEHVHLVGSVALDTVDDVFRECGRTLGRRLKRIPDGEPGGRRLWISWQIPVLRASPYLRQADPGVSAVPLELVPGIKPEEISFGELGYCREARISYQDFCVARDRGDIAKQVRFQVCLPTPFAVITPFVRGDGMFPVLAAYESAMIREAQMICDAIPHNDLAIQWDVCNEMIAWDGQPNPFIPPISNKKQAILRPLARLCDAIPDGVELGIHLCYGDYDAKHFVEPVDATRMVELANAIAETSSHPLAWVHMPVPISRDDDAFFEPLKDLKLDLGTEVYLGLVHEDGAEATQRRIATASRHLPRFGIATECGIARQRTKDRVEKLIRIHAESSKEPAD